MKKPRAFKIQRSQIDCVPRMKGHDEDGSYNYPPIIYLSDNVQLTLKQAQRFDEWLGRAIRWLKEQK